LPNGTYVLTAKAFDLNGGSATAISTIGVNVAPGPGPGPDPTPVPGGTFSVSGRVANKSGQALMNALVTITGGPTGGTRTLSTNSAGYYAFSNVAAGNYIVNAALGSYQFEPRSYNVNISVASVAGINFTGYTGPFYKISGRVASSAGVGIPNVTVKRTGSATAVVTNSAGYYTFTSVPVGSYTLTPSRTGYSFSPVTKSTTVTNTDVIGQNFIGSSP
jgi:hypothetical protein